MKKFLIKAFIYIFYGGLCYKKIADLQSTKMGKLLDPYTYWSKTNVMNLANDLKPQGNVLDVGSGGQWARNIFEMKGHKYLGCDIRECVNPEKQDFFVDDARIPLPENSQDLIISNSVLEHIDTPELAVSEVNRILKKGGQFYCQTNFLYQEHGNPNDYYRFTLNGLTAIMLRNNFTIIDTAKIGDFSTFINDNTAAYIVNKMSILLGHFFNLKLSGRLASIPMLLIVVVVNNLVSAITLIMLLCSKFLGVLCISNNTCYPGVYILCKKI